MISHNNYYSCLFVITDNSDYQQVIEIINKQGTTVGGTDVQWWGKEWVHGYMWMACNKSRIAIRVSNLCRPHVNAKCLNDVRKSDNQARPGHGASGYVSSVVCAMSFRHFMFTWSLHKLDTLMANLLLPVNCLLKNKSRMYMYFRRTLPLPLSPISQKLRVDNV